MLVLAKLLEQVLQGIAGLGNLRGIVGGWRAIVTGLSPQRLLALQAPPVAGDLAADDRHGQGQQLIGRSQVIFALAQNR